MSFPLNLNPHPKRKFVELSGDLEFQNSKYQQFDDSVVQQTTTTTMPGRFYSRKRRSVTPRFFKRRFNLKRGVAAKMARRAFSQPFRTGGRFRGMGEIKYIDATDVSATSVYNTTGLVTLINPIAQGDDNTNRDGRQIRMVSVHMRGRIEGPDTVQQDAGCRTLIVYDRQTNATALTIAGVLGTSATAFFFNNLDNKDRFVVLFDSYTTVGYHVNTATQAFAKANDGKTVQIFNKRVNLPVTYSGTGATVASITTGSLYLITLGDQASDTPYLLWRTRVRFVEQ